MAISFKTMSNILNQMDALTRIKLAEFPKKMWEQTHIKFMIDLRDGGETEFPVQEHLRAMVYAMLSGSISWFRIEDHIDPKTGRITSIDKLFKEYDPTFLTNSNPRSLRDGIKHLKFASQSTNAQMKALTSENLPKLLEWERNYGSVDRYYQSYLNIDPSGKLLVRELSSPNSNNKMTQLGEALAAEYLRNLGYDLPKPDRHICEMLGCNRLGFGTKPLATLDEVFDTVQGIKEETQKRIAEVDYILWSFCAARYGDICTTNDPKCEQCPARCVCHYRKDGSD